jgi:ABC-type transport system substrate-binding protein
MFRFTILVAGEEGPAVFVQDQLRRIGVRADLQPLDQASVRERLRAGEFEAILAPYDNNPGSLGRLGLGGGAPLGYTNAEVVRLVAEAGATTDPHSRDRIYGELTEILRRDAPLTFLFPRVNVVFAHRRLHGLRSPWKADPAWHMEELWLEEEEE